MMSKMVIASVMSTAICIIIGVIVKHMLLSVFTPLDVAAFSPFRQQVGGAFM